MIQGENMINYPNGKKHKQSAIKTNTAGRGMTLENDLNTSNAYFLQENIANIHKKPTPIQIVNVDYPKRSAAKITEAYFKLQSTTDYNGVYKGKAIDFEAKETKLEIMQSQLEREQTKLKRLYSLYADGNDTVLEMIKDLESQISKTKEDISVESKNAINTQKKEFTYQNIKKLADIWDKVDKKQKNLILKTIIDKIVIVNGNIEIQLKNF